MLFFCCKKMHKENTNEKGVAVYGNPSANKHITLCNYSKLTVYSDKGDSVFTSLPIVTMSRLFLQ